MEKKKLNRIIEILREEMMTANPPGGQGGFGSNPTPASTAKTRAGFDPLLGKKKKRRPTPLGRYRTRVNWKQNSES